MAQDIPQLIADARTLLATLPYQATECLPLIATVDQREKTHTALKPFATAQMEEAHGEKIVDWHAQHDTEGVSLMSDPAFENGSTPTIGQFKRARAAFQSEAIIPESTKSGGAGLMSPFVRPTIAEMEIARQVVDSPPVIHTYAACEWDEMHEDGQVWLAAIVREAARNADGKSRRHIAVSMEAPVRWSARTFFRATQNHTGGIVLGFAPTFFALGIELITGETRGVALMIGPFWFGFAVSKFDRETH